MLLQRLNMDNTWLIGSGDTRLLVDPWLGGEQIDGASWFSAQRHKTAPVPLSEVPKYDAVLITQPYSDHCHPETLSALCPDTVLAPICVAKTLNRVLPDAEIRLMTPDAAPIQIGALSLRVLKGSSTFAPQFQAIHLSDEAHSILFAPHSLEPTERHLELLSELPPCVALMTTLNTYTLPRVLGGAIAPGLKAVEKLAEAIDPTHIISTHDEVKEARGLIAHLAQITPFDPQVLSEHSWLSTRFLAFSDYSPVTLEATRLAVEPRAV